MLSYQISSKHCKTFLCVSFGGYLFVQTWTVCCPTSVSLLAVENLQWCWCLEPNSCMISILRNWLLTSLRRLKKPNLVNYVLSFICYAKIISSTYQLRAGFSFHSDYIALFLLHCGLNPRLNICWISTLPVSCIKSICILILNVVISWIKSCMAVLKVQTRPYQIDRTDGAFGWITGKKMRRLMSYQRNYNSYEKTILMTWNIFGKVMSLL